jgi:hypothetical protein
MKSVHPSSPSFQPGRHLEVLDEPVHDAQRDAERMASPAVCTECGAVYGDGHWSWTSAPSHAIQMRCPACRRVAEGRPAAHVTISGQFAQEHADEVTQLVRDVEHREKTAHALRRIMAITPNGDELEVSTTDVRLAQDICNALLDAFDGKLNVDYDEDERLLRMKWIT